MSFITTQQTKLDLELVPKENRLDIRKCNGRIPHGLTPREPTFQVVLYAIALTLCYPTFLIMTDVPRVYMHQFWNSVYKHDTFYRFKLDKKNPAMKESKSYKTYLGYATGVVPPKIERKFKKTSPSKKANDLVPVDEEPISKENMLRDLPRSLQLLQLQVSFLGMLLWKNNLKERKKKKSLRDFHKLHPSGVPDVTKYESTKSESESWGNDEDDRNDKNESENEDKDEENKSNDDETTFDSEKGLDSEQDTDGSESDSESDQQDDDDEVKDDDDDDKSEGDTDRGMDSDYVQDKKADVGMTDAEQEKENLEITQEQVVEDS
uniref:Uncharacterized protein n=1 Tax=Tanacetum cinerariifolium TaxID=118510 RepID=A0A6L2MVD6_TANCI|nr:hypothetical protein [Tanacetum cinerariifolium]